MKMLTPEGEKNLKRMKRNLKALKLNFIDWVYDHMLLAMFAIACWAITPGLIRIAYLERGYWAIGGEWLVLFIFFFAWVIGKAIEDDRK